MTGSVYITRGDRAVFGNSGRTFSHGVPDELVERFCLYGPDSNVIEDYLRLVPPVAGDYFGERRIYQNRGRTGQQAPFLDFIQLVEGECAQRWVHKDDGYVGLIPTNWIMGQLGRGALLVPHRDMYIWLDGQRVAVQYLWATDSTAGRQLLGGGFWNTTPPRARSEIRGVAGESQERWTASSIYPDIDFFERYIGRVTNITTWTTVKTLTPSAVAGVYCRGAIKATITGHNSNLGNGYVTARWYYDINNAAPTVGVDDVFFSGNPPQFRLNVSVNDIRCQVNMDGGGVATRFDGTVNLEITGTSGAGTIPTYTVS